jgi:hypothetical protein
VSVNIYWQPAEQKHNVPANAPSSFVEAMNARCGSGKPWMLDRSHLDFLAGLRHAGLVDVEILIDAIRQHDVIRCWPEY